MTWRPPWLPITTRPSSMGAWADEMRVLDDAELAPADDEDDDQGDDTEDE